MARPLSEEKRNAILVAAAENVATDGLAARTAKIAVAAGVAEGTVFTYFATKETLFNALYVTLKGEVGDAMLAGFQQRESVLAGWQKVWDSYVEWGLCNGVKRKALKQLHVSACITPDSRKAALHTTKAMAATLLKDLAAAVQHPQSPEFIAAIFEALVEMTIDMIAKAPASHEYYKREGFESFWRAATCL